jgi:hypothetical protein
MPTSHAERVTLSDAVWLNVGVLLSVASLGVSLMLLLVSLVSYARLRSTKMLLAGGAFAVLAIQGGLWAWRGIALRETDLPSLTLDVLVLGFLYASVASR